jgi:hypothetical protein
MSEPANHVHPRKLYSMLRDCADARARAVAALDFLCSSMGAESGFLLLARGGELSVASSSRDRAIAPDLMERALQLWAKESDAQPEGDDTRTVDIRQLVEPPAASAEQPVWTLSNGERYETRLLSVYRDSIWVPVGLALLEHRSAQPLRPIRGAHVEALCSAFLDCADVSGR